MGVSSSVKVASVAGAPLYLRLSAAEEAELTRRATEAGLTRQNYLRATLGDEPPAAPVPALVGSKEAAEILGGLTKQQMHSRSKAAGFPEPVQRLAAGPVWRRSDIEALA